jgi:hypothetical protein
LPSLFPLTSSLTQPRISRSHFSSSHFLRSISSLIASQQKANPKPSQASEKLRTPLTRFSIFQGLLLPTAVKKARRDLGAPHAHATNRYCPSSGGVGVGVPENPLSTCLDLNLDLDLIMGICISIVAQNILTTIMPSPFHLSTE